MQYFNNSIIFIIATLLTSTLPLHVIADSLHWDNKLLKTPIIALKKHSLYFTNWINYISPALILSFKKLYNVNIRLIYTTDGNMTRAKVMTGASDFDLIEQGALYLPGEIKSNALIPLDKTKLAN